MAYLFTTFFPILFLSTFFSRFDKCLGFLSLHSFTGKKYLHNTVGRKCTYQTRSPIFSKNQRFIMPALLQLHCGANGTCKYDFFSHCIENEKLKKIEVKNNLEWNSN